MAENFLHGTPPAYISVSLSNVLSFPEDNKKSSHHKHTANKNIPSISWQSAASSWFRLGTPQRVRPERPCVRVHIYRLTTLSSTPIVNTSK